MPEVGKSPGGTQRIPLIGVGSEEDFTQGLDRRSDYYRHKAWAAVQSREPEPLFTLPTVLTLLRLVLVPVFIYLWLDDGRLSPLLSAITFTAASITDWLDGYLARKLGLATAFGAFLDPVADKIMVSAALILLANSPPADISITEIVYPVIIIISREISMSALREWAASSSAEAHKAVKVSSLGKWKTAAQMTSMSIMLFCRKAENLLGEDSAKDMATVRLVVRVSYALLLVSAGLSVWSLWVYIKNAWVHFRYPNGVPESLKKKAT
mmetsp:Transcript_25629/g.64670  ORF Transcript_25629/g.64670 Transcript_25629/m.64670 type:complete len:267 (+) Transcript_25629:287-1087(+)|eukprot:jgi/Tetstr1/421508/TSEL_012456.t1